VPLGDLFARCYLVFTVLDRPGVLGKIASILGEHEISIESVIQQGRDEAEGAVPIVILTHPAREADVRSALADAERLPEVSEPTRVIRIEEEL
jgi:homoserine dehydrogenase